jgi:hypothetical protein
MDDTPAGVQPVPAVASLEDARMSGSMMSLSVVVTGDKKTEGMRFPSA